MFGEFDKMVFNLHFLYFLYAIDDTIYYHNAHIFVGI